MKQINKYKDEKQTLFDVVTDYTYALDTLDNYDYELAMRRTILSRAVLVRSIRRLGINPGSEGGIKEYSGAELLKGNPCFERNDNDYIINYWCPIKN